MTFVDRQKPAQLPSIFAAADVFISPAAKRSIDLTSLLAMAAGVPVLSVDQPVSDFLIDEKTAVLFKESDANSLSAALSVLLDSHTAARSLATTALAYVREHHSPVTMVSQLTKIYREATS